MDKIYYLPMAITFFIGYRSASNAIKKFKERKDEEDI